MKKNKKRGIIGLFSFIALAVVAIMAFMMSRYYWDSSVVKDGILLVPTAADYRQLSDSLSQGGFLTNQARFNTFAHQRKLDQSIRGGRYELKAGMSYSMLINTLRSGRQTPVRLTFNNLRTVDRLAGVIGRRLEVDSLTMLQSFRDDTLIRSLGFTRPTLIGMFIPNTYELYWNISPKELINRMKKEYDRFWNEERLAKLSRTGLTQQQVMTLASIVYEETKQEREMPRVAGVYINRLRKGILLQADPTVIYAMGDFTIKRVLFSYLSVDSPYNTYKYAGLPPGPICMPSIAAVEGVLNYEQHNYIYFCAKDDLSGAHNFAVTLSEHNRNAQAYSAALNRLKIKR